MGDAKLSDGDELVSSRLKTVEALLGYLKSKARVMTVDRDSVSICGKSGVVAQQVEEQVARAAVLSREHVTAVTEISDAMELLLRRALVAEAQAELEKEKARCSEEEVKRKSAQIDGMWCRVEEMERVALGTGSALREMQMKLQDMEVETCRQRQRANENEMELSRVKRDFGALKVSVENLSNARDTIRSMERRIQEVERVSESLTARLGGLEARKQESEAEIRNLMHENDKLRGELDVKEAELAASSDHVKMLVLSA